MYEVKYDPLDDKWRVVKGNKIFYTFYTEETAQRVCDELNEEESDGSHSV